MVTGIETAGLVLGAFPIVIEGLRIYVGGIRTIKTMLQHELILTQFCRDLAMEQTKFEDICYQLLGDMVPAGSPILDELMQDPGGEKWKNQYWEIALQHRLCRQASRDRFLEATQQLQLILQQLQKKVRPKMKNDGTRLRSKALKRFLDKFDTAFNEADRKDQIARIRNLNEDLRTLVNGPIVFSSTTIPQTFNPARQYNCVQTHAMAIYDIINEKFQAKICGCKSASLFLKMCIPCQQYSRALQFPRFQCIFSSGKNQETEWRELVLEGCDEQSLINKQKYLVTLPEHHRINIPHIQCDEVNPKQTAAEIDNEGICTTPGDVQPENIPPNIDNGYGKQSRKKKVLQFLGISKNQEDCEQLSRPVSPAAEPFPEKVRMKSQKPKHVSWPDMCEDLASPADFIPEEIKCFCTTLQTTNISHNCLGILVSNINQRQHKIWIPERQWLKFPAERTVPLDQILNSPGTWKPPTQETRLKLAVQLASALLQLHQSGWLNESWGKSDIFFALGSHGPIYDKPLVHHAEFPPTYLSQTIPDIPDTKKEDPLAGCSSAWCNQSVLCLGLLLIEVWHWKTLSMLQREEYSDKDEAQSPSLDAVQLARNLVTDAGYPYGLAVKLCITGLDLKDTNLEEQEFKNEVYAKIVYPLEEHLKNFCGVKDLERVFND